MSTTTSNERMNRPLEMVDAEIAGLTERLDIEFQAFSRMLGGKQRAAGALNSRLQPAENPENSR